MSVSRPRILAPLSAVAEVEPLCTAGADEFYCGVYPEQWAQRWGLATWPNRRGPGRANLRTEEALNALGAACRAAERPLYLVLNASFHTDEQLAFLTDFAVRAARDAGIEAVIASDLALIVGLVRQRGAPRVFVSTLGLALNSETVAFYRDLGVSRVILGRHLHVREIAAIRAAVRDVEIEAFVLNDHCRYEEGLCSTCHALPGSGVYCMAERSRRLVHDSGPEVSEAEHERWRGAWRDEDHHLRRFTSKELGAGPAAVPLGPCGLCAIAELASAGIDSLKVVGREADLYRKLRSVQLVRAVRNAWEAGGDPGACRRLAEQWRGDPAGCAEQADCIYRR